MEEKDWRSDTEKHIDKVGKYMQHVRVMLGHREDNHDQSKLESPEKELFEEYEDKLSKVTYDSDEYWALMKKLEPAIEHHYKRNRHHPEHWDNGIEDMNLIDIVEMFCDWWAASERHQDGNIFESIEKNKERFDLSDQLVEILKNTVSEFY